MLDSSDIFTAAASFDDAEVRQRGIGFIDDSVPGYALLMGDNAAEAAPLLEELTQRKILTFIVDKALGADLGRGGQPLGWDSGVVSLDFSETLDFITRVAQTFGNADAPDEALDYARQRLRGFTILLGEPRLGVLLSPILCSSESRNAA